MCKRFALIFLFPVFFKSFGSKIWKFWNIKKKSENPDTKKKLKIWKFSTKWNKISKSQKQNENKNLKIWKISNIFEQNIKILFIFKIEKSTSFFFHREKYFLLIFRETIFWSFLHVYLYLCDFATPITQPRHHIQFNCIHLSPYKHTHIIKNDPQTHSHNIFSYFTSYSI